MKKRCCYLCVLFFIVLFLSCCAMKEKQSDQELKKNETVHVSVNEKISEQLEIAVDKKIKVLNTEKYRVQILPYSVSEERAVSLLDTYLLSEENIPLEKKEQYGIQGIYARDDDIQFDLQETGIYFSRNDTFNSSAGYYYRNTGLYPFFIKEMDTYYSQNDLSFLSYTEAEHMCEALLEEIQYTYDPEKSKGYALTEEALARYRNENIDEFSKRENDYKEHGLDTLISDWTESGGFYVFYYPLKIDNIETELDTETISTMMMHAEIVIDKTGIAKAHISPLYEVVSTEEISIVSPKTILNKAVEMYDNVIIDGQIKITDITPVLTQTNMENTDKSETDIKYVLSPAWKLTVLMDIGGEKSETALLYDAETGRQISQ